MMFNEEKNIDQFKGGSNNPLKVPEGYFDSNAIQLKAITKENSKVKRLRVFATSLAVAATIAIIGIFVFQPTSTSVELNTEEIIALMDECYLSLDSYTLASIDIENIEMDYYSSEDASSYLELQDLDYLDDELLNY